MQVNERVWRGMYDLRKLRWDIRYTPWPAARSSIFICAVTP